MRPPATSTVATCCRRDLQGDRGAPGRTGEKGERGFNGMKGWPGETGVSGRRGSKVFDFYYLQLLR